MPTTSKKKQSIKHTLLAHGRASLTRVAPHVHTGKKISRRHTSHGVLLLLVLVTGAALLLSSGSFTTAAYQHVEGPIDHSTTVSAHVGGPAPTVGAIITSPQTQTRVTKPLITVEGTCPADTVVVISRNGQFAGSTICQADDTFTVIIQLEPRTNLIQAQNYDAGQQAGPSSSPITVIYDPPAVQPPITTIDQEESVNKDDDYEVDPTIPVLPPVPPVDCATGTSQSPADTLRLAVTCIPTIGFLNETLRYSLTITGGSPAYAVSIDWGDGSADDLFSFSTAGQHTVSHTFKTAGYKLVKLRVVDASGASYQIQVVVLINGETVAGGNTLPDAWYTFWLNATIPLYLLVLALFIGFWIGDIFERITEERTRPLKRRRA